jgi:hypothetical protein
MHSCDLRESEVLCGQRRGNSGKSKGEPLHIDFSPANAAQQPFEIALGADKK